MARAIEDVQIQNARLLPGKYAVSGWNATPRSKYTHVIVDKTRRRRGKRIRRPAAENAYNAQVNRTPAIAVVMTGGYQ
jgi:hypothetical protein